MTMKFNEQFNEEGETPRFIHKLNPLVERAFQIFEYQDHKKNYEPVGDYTVIDDNEDFALSEKKIMNLMGVMNGKKRLIDFKNLTNERILFNIVTRDEGSTQQKVVFRTYNGDGTSVENAVMTIEKGVFDE